MPHVQLPSIPLQDLPPAFARLAEASAVPQQQVLRMCEAVSRLQEDVEQGARLMFDEGAVWDQCLESDGDVECPDAAADRRQEH